MRLTLPLAAMCLISSAAHAQYDGYAIFSCQPSVQVRYAECYPAYRQPRLYTRYRYASCGTTIGYGYRYAPAYDCYPYDRWYATSSVAPRFRRATGVYSVYGEVTGYAPPRRYEDVVGQNASRPDAWELLGEGDSRTALKLFTIDARNGDDTAAKIGYAVAAADVGDDHTAIWAMRRAFRLDARGATYVPLDDDLRGVFEDHRDYYEYKARLDIVETSFMVAALSFVMRDYEAARVAADRCREHSDRSSELRQLERQLDRIEREAENERVTAHYMIVEEEGG